MMSYTSEEMLFQKSTLPSITVGEKKYLSRIPKMLVGMVLLMAKGSLAMFMDIT